MKRREFEQHVTQALEGLPQEIKERLDNVDILVQLWPTREQLVENGISDKHDLLGLYEGIPLTERTASYGAVLPDRVTIFQGPLEESVASEEELVEEIRKTVVHELAHFFGWGDADLERLGYG